MFRAHSAPQAPRGQRRCWRSTGRGRGRPEPTQLQPRYLCPSPPRRAAVLPPAPSPPAPLTARPRLPAGRQERPCSASVRPSARTQPAPGPPGRELRETPGGGEGRRWRRPPLAGGGGPGRLRSRFLFRFPGRWEPVPGCPGPSAAPALPLSSDLAPPRPWHLPTATACRWLLASVNPFPQPLVSPWAAPASRGEPSSFLHTRSLNIIRTKLQLKLRGNLGQQCEGFVSGSRIKILWVTVA